MGGRVARAAGTRGLAQLTEQASDFLRRDLMTKVSKALHDTVDVGGKHPAHERRAEVGEELAMQEPVVKRINDASGGVHIEVITEVVSGGPVLDMAATDPGRGSVGEDLVEGARTVRRPSTRPR